MDQVVQCPVCTLYLHNGMSLESHLDTHPKDQVIKALCSLSSNRSSYGSRASTPVHSERSYRSRSRTPATEEAARWNTPHSTDHERFWRRTPSRTPKTSTVTRVETPDLRIGDSNFDSSGSINTSNSVFSNPSKSEKPPQPYPSVPVSDYEQPYSYFPEQKEEKEIKYSRSAEYNSQNNTNSVYAYNMTTPCVRLNALLPAQKRNEPVNMLPTNKNQDFIKLLPKSRNIALVKANVGTMQYIAPGVMVSSGPTFVQKNNPNNLIVTSNLQNPMVQSKSITTPLSSHQYNQMAPSPFAPNTTVVTQNSQIIYSEMVHSIDAKRFIPGGPAAMAQENITNVSQTSSMYQNVMVVDQFGNTSCMYSTPQQLLPKPSTSYNQSVPTLDKNVDSNKTLIIEVSPIVAPPPVEVCDASTSMAPRKETTDEYPPEKPEPSGSTKGLKILSNIKVEVPVQHHKNLLNTVVDLTGPTECVYPNRTKSPERILPDIEVTITQNNVETQPSALNSNEGIVTNTFSVIKNVGNPPTYKEAKMDHKIHETESSDSCPVPDLICNEKPSISPCSELSDNGDNATAMASISLKPEPSSSVDIKKETGIPVRSFRSNPLRLNNIYVKKHKKVLQIKNAKSFPVASTSTSIEVVNLSSSQASRLPEDFKMTKIVNHSDKLDNEDSRGSRLETVSINKLNEHEHEFDADTEEQSMDMELEPVGGYPPSPARYPSPPASPSTIDLTQVKEEVNSNDFSNQTGESEREFTPLQALRAPRARYENRDLLELEAAKSKQFVSMMNDNYFGDNIYADYFTPDRVESFDAHGSSASFGKEVPKDGVYLWGEPSQKDSEFVLPNFMPDGYKLPDGAEFALGRGECKAGVLERAEPALDICSDERMPPRGELSGQESNGDMDAPWNGMYQEVTPAEPYDLIARESWISDGSEIDSNEKRDSLEEEQPKPRLFNCLACGLHLPSMKELRTHRAEAHPPPGGSADNTTYSRLMIKKVIKKEDKTDEQVLAGMLQDSKAGITGTVLEVFDPMDESKSKIIIKQEPKRRKRDYVCPTCKVDQVTDVAFHQHLKIHPLECLTCGKCFFRRANLALHIKTHLGIKNYKCEVCEKRFLTRQKLLEHHNVHTGRAPIKCTVCDCTFRRYSNMLQHRDRHHMHKKPKIRDYVCHCGEIYHSRAKLRWHKETHDGKPKACQYCSDKFIHLSSLTRHVRRTHNAYFMRDDLKKNENVPCPVCKQVYLRSNLKTHMRTHSGKRPYHCVICNKAFTTQWNLKLHRWTHMSRSAKPFKCSLCKGAFIRQSEYISHMNAHKSVRPYTCNYCGCQFIRKYNCQRHVKEHETAKKYVCKVPDCGKSFHRSYYLSEHMKVHSGARPFSCNICGKTSSNKSNHNKHVKIHHAREPVATEA
ncbi:uncharacterized protein LOC105383886 [Plutella xylostella]|uniref:uncharacterized protein LOC105383886 n=1 Tax=Plutella xylostella TaxID=51655 RepID=UPI002032B836|nr:uncharacterized protein LOC105383886 [Plutella xylostella]